MVFVMSSNRRSNINSPDEVDTIVNNNIRLIGYMLGRRSHRGCAIDDIDYVRSDMMMGLVRAAELYDQSKGFKFSTYACRAMWMYADRGVIARHKKLRGHLVYSEYDDSWGEPALPKIAVAKEDKEPERKALKEYVASMLNNPRCCLTEREKNILTRYYLHGLTLHVLGAEIGVTKERIRQILLAACGKIKRQYEHQEAA